MVNHSNYCIIGNLQERWKSEVKGARGARGAIKPKFKLQKQFLIFIPF